MKLLNALLAFRNKPSIPEFRLCLGLLLLLASSWPYLATAHSAGTLRLANVAAGPYHLSAWSAPEPPRVGDFHLSVAVDEPKGENSSAASQPSKLDVQITMTAVAQRRDNLIQQATLQTTFFQSYYESYFTIPATGRWQVTVNVTGSAGAGAAQFAFDALPAQRINWELVFWCVTALIALILVGRVVREPGETAV